MLRSDSGSAYLGHLLSPLAHFGSELVSQTPQASHKRILTHRLTTASLSSAGAFQGLTPLLSGFLPGSLYICTSALTLPLA